MSKILTVVVPTYNMETYLRKCLDSLIVPDTCMSLLEVLVVNDGSTDSSLAIAHEYENCYPQTFRVIDKENGHYGSCINRGLKEATGKYIKILDADDSFDNETLVKYLQWVKKQDAELLINNYSLVDRSGTVRVVRKYSLPVGNEFGFEKIPYSKLQMHGVAYKTDNVRKIGYRQSEGVAYTDQEWMFLPMTTVNKVSYFPHSLYMYFVGREGQSISKSIARKSIDQTETGMWAMLKSMGETSFDRKYLPYLIKRLEHRFNGVYGGYIYKYPELNINKLLEIDQRLKVLYPNIYEMSNSIKKKGIPYIKLWRKHPENRFSALLSFYLKDSLLSRLLALLKR